MAHVDSKIDIAKASLGVAYILGTRAWVDTFSTYSGPGEMVIQSGKHGHILTTRDPKQLIERYNNPGTLNNDVVNVIRLGLKDAITQIFEGMKSYCFDTNQLAALRSQSWYHFARLVRNSLSHDFTLNFQLRSGMLPDQALTFSDRTIELKSAMHGQELDFDVFPLKYGLELLEMMRLFARDILV